MTFVNKSTNIISEVAMEKLIKMLEDVMVAITFAEAGEYDEAARTAGNETALEEKSKAPVAARS
jgi:hypothetical protein